MVGFSVYYFSCVLPLRQNRRMVVGLTGSFVFGVAVLIAGLVAYQMINLGPLAGVTILFPELLSSDALLLMFFRVFDEQLAP